MKSDTVWLSPCPLTERLGTVVALPRKVLLLLIAAFILAALLMVASPASAQSCEGYIYDGRRLGAIGALSAEDIASKPYELRCLIGSAREQAGDLPPAPEGYVWNSDYSLSPEVYSPTYSDGCWWYDDYEGWYYW